MELELVRQLCHAFPGHPAMKLGPGDDAAILEWPGMNPQMAVSTDLLTEGVDFFLERMNPRKIGRKSLAVNVSDLAAMAAEPVGCVISVALPEKPRFGSPSDFDEETDIFLSPGKLAEEKSVSELMARLSEGFLDLTNEIPLVIAGGDTNFWDGGLVISVTVFGQVVGKPLCRSGAKPGDAIFVTGNLGGSILRHQFDFKPRTREMAILRDRFPLHAGMDISDGLLLDLSRLLEQSGCGAILDTRKIPISPDAERLSRLEPQKTVLYDWIPKDFAAKTPLEHALSDGEDFEILFTVPPEAAVEVERDTALPVCVTRIGEMVAGNDIHDFDGTVLKRDGFVHGAS